MRVRVYFSLFLLCCLLLIAKVGEAQITSAQNGPWNMTTTWNGGVIPDFSNSTSILVNHNINIPSGYSVTIDQTSINVGRTLTIDNGGTMIVNDGTGTDLNFNTGFGTAKLNVDGVLQINDNATIGNPSKTRLTIQSRGVYRHNYVNSGGTIYAATWDPPTPGIGATLEFTGYGSIGDSPSGLNQTFHHVTWNCGGQGGFIDLNLADASTKINGNFNITDTNGQFLVVSQADYTLDVLGDFNISGNSSLALNGFFPTTADVNVLGNFSYTSTAESWFAVDGTTTLNVLGGITINGSGGSIDLSNNSGGSTGSTLITIPSTFAFTNGTLTNSADVTNCTLRFTNNTTYTKGVSSSYNGRINFDITGALDLGTSHLAGTGTLSVNNAAELRVGSTDANGAIQTGTLAGNIRVSGVRIYTSGSTITYNGAAAQFIGNGHPTSSGVDITIANSNGVSIIAPTTLAGTINLTGGNLNIGSSSLTITGSITGSQKISIGSLGSLNVGGGSNIGTFPFVSGAQSFTNFTLNNTNGITFANDVTLSGVLTLTNGNLNFNNQMLTLNGTLAAGGGSFSGNASSTLAIGGTGAFGSLPLSGTIGTLTFDRSSGTADINGSLMVSNTFNLLNGDFTNTNGLQMANGSLLRRKSASAQLLGNPPTNLPAGQFYNVAYSDIAGLGSGLTTGLELPNTTDDNLGSLTVNSSASVILDKNIIVNGGVNLQSGTLSAGSNNITMNATPGTWSKTSGTFNGGTGSVIIAGNITISASSTPNFTNIIANSGSSLTFPSGNINISGDLQLNSGGTFVPNGGTIILNGSGGQTITGAGRTFVNLTVNKTGGNVALLPSVNLTGILNILSATTVQSNGNLILISTSDAASGNASIAKIPTGASVTGNVSVQRFMSAENRIQREISSAVQSPQVAQIQTPVAGSGGTGITITGSFTGTSFPCAGCTSNGPSMYFYNEVPGGASSAGWTGSNFPVASNTETLQTGRGYSLLVRNELGARTMALTGTINSGDINLPVTYNSSGSPADDGWNLVGNPYPSSIDWNNSLGWVKSAIQGNMISVWDAGLKQYKSWNGSTGSLGSGRIAQGQAFWIQANGAPTLTVKEDAKTPTTGAFYKIGDLDYLEIILAKGSLDDRAYLQRMEGSSEAIDGNDGRKLPNATFSLSTLSSDGESLTFNTSDNIMCNSTVQLKVTYDVEPTNINGTYKFSTNAVGQYQATDVLLSDAFTSTTFDLTNGAEYNYDVTDNAASRAADRFTLSLTPKAVALNLGVSGSAEVCAGSEGLITVTNAEAGIGYYPELNGVRIGDTYFGIGADLSLTYPGANLENGLNNVTVKAVNLCGISSLTQQIQVSKDALYTPVPVSGKSCLSGEVTLSASGAPTNGTYRWYAEEGAVSALFEGTSFVTPTLDKTKTYYVAAVNSLGCEGQREPVVAEVTNYDEATIEVQGNQLISNYSSGIQWFKDGEPITGANGKTLQVEESGNYTVTVTVGTCTTSAAREMVVTGLEDLANGVSGMYPNPVIDRLNIRYPGTGPLSATIYEGAGRKIATKELAEEQGYRVGSFDMSTSSQGVYYLQLTDNTKVVLLKFLKK